MTAYYAGYDPSPPTPSFSHSREPSWLAMGGFPESQSQSPSRQLPSCAEGFGQAPTQQQQTTQPSAQPAPPEPAGHQHALYPYHPPQSSVSPAFSMRTTSSTHLHHDLNPPLANNQLAPWQALPPAELPLAPTHPALGLVNTQIHSSYGVAYPQHQSYSPELPTSPASCCSASAVSPTPSIDPNAVYPFADSYAIPPDLPSLTYYQPGAYTPYPEQQAPWVPVTVRPYQPDLPSSPGSSRARHTASPEHVQHKRFACPYPGCTLRFARLNDQQRHSRIHSGECPFACRRCGHRFKRSDARRRHELKEIC